ncbi:hypothetical protein D3C80_689000 [compost metagenome]
MSSGMLKFSALALAASLGAMNSLSPAKAIPSWGADSHIGRTATRFRTSGAGVPGAQKHRAKRKAKKKMRQQSRKKK